MPSPTPPPTASLGLRRLALCALIFLPGIGISSWVTRTPAVRDQLGASTAEMGMVLFGLSVGSMIGILSSGPLVIRLGGRPVALVASISLVLALPVIAAGAAAGVPLVAAIGLGMFGAGMGGGEVAMNIEGAAVEEDGGRTFLPMLHGCFSLGTVIGAVAGIAANAADVSVIAHLVVIGVVGAALVIWAIRYLPPHTGRIVPADRDEPTGAPKATVFRDMQLVMIGGIVLAVALAEGTANDWLPLVMVDGHGFDATWGSAVYAVFAASMTVGRFAGGPIVDRVGRVPVLAVSLVCAVLGLATVSLVDNQVVAASAVVLWGLGTSLGFPVALSAAGDSGPNPAARVALASVVGYLAFLVGPPVLGFVGEHLGLRTALLLPAAVAVLALTLTPATRRRGSAADGTGDAGDAEQEPAGSDPR